MLDNYKKLLRNIPALPKKTLDSIKLELVNDPVFQDYCKKNLNWDLDEHDGLIKLLELPKNTSGYYVDKYEQRISYNGIKTLRRSGTEIDLNPLQQAEYDKCKADFKYFRTHYCFITTKTGLARPEPRFYQEELEDELLSLEDLIILYPRQSGKTVTVSTYLLWLALFYGTAINIGIVANKGSTAREVLDKIKKIFQEMPLWLMSGVESWNKSSIEFENSTRVMTDSPSSDSFRGYTINILYEDESAYINGNLYSEYVDSVYPTMNSLIFKQVINSSTPKGMNHYFHLAQGATQNNKMEEPEEIIVEDGTVLQLGGNGVEMPIEKLYEYIQERNRKMAL